MRFLDRLDDYGSDEPGFHEGFPEDRCPLCDRPVCDHPAASAVAAAFRSSRTAYPAKWPHRRAAAFALFLARFTCSG